MITEPYGVAFRHWTNSIPNDGLILGRALFNQDLLIPVGPAALADVLTNKCYDFEKPNSFRLGSLRILGNGILLAEEDVHKVPRFITTWPTNSTDIIPRVSERL